MDISLSLEISPWNLPHSTIHRTFPAENSRQFQSRGGLWLLTVKRVLVREGVRNCNDRGYLYSEILLRESAASHKHPCRKKVQRGVFTRVMPDTDYNKIIHLLTLKSPSPFILLPQKQALRVHLCRRLLPEVKDQNLTLNETEITNEQPWAKPKIVSLDTETKTAGFNPETTTTSSTK